jgi:hypothetical protein
MQLIGSLGLFAVCVAAFAGLWISLYRALPKTVLEYAERHGRFQGLADQETLAGGTRAGEPPAARPLVLGSQSV